MPTSVWMGGDDLSPPPQRWVQPGQRDSPPSPSVACSATRRGWVGRRARTRRGSPGTLRDDRRRTAVHSHRGLLHKPGALEAVLRAARELTAGRLICVFGGGRRPVSRQAAADGSGCERARGLAVRDLGQPAQRDPVAIIEESSPAWMEDPVVGTGPSEGDRDRNRRGRRGRRRRYRGEGKRAGPGVRRPQDPVRRPRGRPRGTAATEGAGVIPLPVSELEDLGRLGADGRRRDRRPDRLAMSPARRSLRRRPRWVSPT